MGAVFRGKGVFSFVPANRIERERLRRLEKADSLETPFTELLLVFADSTLEELDATLDFASAAAGGGEAGVVRQGLELLADQDSRTFEPDLMAAFLNGERSELFYAHIKRSGGGPLMFMLNPNEFEGVRLLSKIRRRGYDRRAEVVTQFPLAGRAHPGPQRGERHGQADIRSYVIDASLLPSASSARSASSRRPWWRSSPTRRWVLGLPSNSSKSCGWTRPVGTAANARPWSGARRARCSGCSSTDRSSRARCAPCGSTTEAI